MFGTPRARTSPVKKFAQRLEAGSPRSPRSPHAAAHPRSPARELDLAVHHRQHAGEEPWQWLGRAKGASVLGAGERVARAGAISHLVLHAREALPANYRGGLTRASVAVLPRRANASPVYERDVSFDEADADAVDLSFGPLARAGEYLLAVTLEGGHVRGSPFPLRVTAGTPLADRCELVGADGADASARTLLAVAGCEASFALLARDANENRCESGGEAVAVRFDVRLASLAPGRTVADARVECAVTDRGDGSYVMCYTSRLAATYDATVTLNGATVGRLQCVVRAGPTAPATLDARLDGAAARAADGADAAAGEPLKVQMFAKDAFENRRDAGGDGWRVELRLLERDGAPAADADTVVGRVRDHGDGSYTVTVTPSAAGLYEACVFAADGSLARPPLRVRVGAGVVDARASALISAALAAGVLVAGEAADIRVEPRDANGNNPFALPPREGGGDDDDDDDDDVDDDDDDDGDGDGDDDGGADEEGFGGVGGVHGGGGDGGGGGEPRSPEVQAAEAEARWYRTHARALAVDAADARGGGSPRAGGGSPRAGGGSPRVGGARVVFPPQAQASLAQSSPSPPARSARKAPSHTAGKTQRARDRPRDDGRAARRARAALGAELARALRIQITDLQGQPDERARARARREGPALCAQLVAARAGPALVHVSLRGAPLAGSPFRVRVLAGPAHASRCVARGVQWRARAGEPQSAALELADRFGNARDSAGGAQIEFHAAPPPTALLASGALQTDPLLARLAPSVSEATAAACGDGGVALRWTPARAGVWSLSATVDGLAVPGLAAAAVLVEPGVASARFSSVEAGTRLEGEVLEAGGWVAFLLVARDAWGNLTRRGGDELELSCSAADEPALMRDRGDGSYELRFCPLAPGAHTVRVALPHGGGDVFGSPWSFSVAPGVVSARRCETTAGALCGAPVRGGVCRFAILAFDARGLRRTQGGDAFECVLAPREHGHYGQVSAFVDNGDGSYDVEVVTHVSGRYALHVTLDGHHLSGSPFAVAMAGGAGAGAASALGGPPAKSLARSPRARHRVGEAPWGSPGSAPASPRHNAMTH
jgi:uncharacterized membrane protein YgcG